MAACVVCGQRKSDGYAVPARGGARWHCRACYEDLVRREQRDAVRNQTSWADAGRRRKFRPTGRS